MPYIALFLEKKMYFRALEVSAPRPPRYYLHVLLMKQNFQSGQFYVTVVRLFGLRSKYYNRVTIANVLSLLLRPVA